MTLLVRTAKEPKVYRTGKEAGLGQSDFVVLINGQPKMFQEVEGPADLDAGIVIGDAEDKTGFRMVRGRAHAGPAPTGGGERARPAGSRACPSAATRRSTRGRSRPRPGRGSRSRGGP